MSILEEHGGLVRELCQYSKLCYQRHLVGATGGNLSVRVPDRNAFIVTASGVSLRDVEPADLVVIDACGGIAENPSGHEPSKEIGFHLAIYGKKPDVNAVVHVHPTFATVYAVVGKPIPLSTVSAKFKLKQAPLVTEAEPGSSALADYVARALLNAQDDANVVLLGRHGLASFGSTLRGAFDDAELAEDTARVSLFATLLGQD